METTEFKKLLGKLRRAQSKYQNLLNEAEEAYEQRYGSNPSDVDDDFWLDTFHGQPTEYNFKKLEEAAKFANR